MAGWLLWDCIFPSFIPVIEPGKPVQNAFIESFNGKLRIEAWRQDYNQERPHSALGNLTPLQYAEATQVPVLICTFVTNAATLHLYICLSCQLPCVYDVHDTGVTHMDKVSIPEAAQRLRVHERTIRRWLERGELQGEKIPRGQGHVWLVYLDNANDTAIGSVHDSDHDLVNGMVQLDLGKIQELQARLEEKDALVAALQGQIADLKAQLSQKDWQIGQILQELGVLRQLALPAPKKPGVWRRLWKR
jgi:putative transposase